MQRQGSVPDSADVLVLGAGLGGHCAALEAAQQGASVVLLEKTTAPGGSSRQSAGSFAFAATEAQRAEGIADSLEDLESDIVSASANKADPVLVRLYVENQAQIYEWLKGNGVEFHKIALSSNMSAPRTHPTNPKQLIQALNARVMDEKRIAYQTGIGPSRLLKSARGEVAGVSIPGGKGELRAGAVVLATGGFSRNPGLIERFSPHMASALPAGGEGNVGDGLMMAWSMGADLVDMAYINGTFGLALTHYPEFVAKGDEEPLLRLAIYKGAIAVNLEGKRFADESISYKTLGEFCLKQPKAIGFQIFDQKIMNQSEPAPTSHDLMGAYEKGVVRKAASVGELAMLLGIDAAQLERTVARYNEGARKGRDEDFGRTALSKTVGKLVPIEQPPFYGIPCTTAVLATYCGVRVNDQMQVIDVYGEPIPGLYAAGEMVGGFHGAGYMSGTALGKAAIFGRIAGRTAARHALSSG